MLEQLKNMPFLPSFGKKTSTLLGVDISSTAVKILQLAATGDSYRLEDYVIRPLPANSVVEKNINDLDAVAFKRTSRESRRTEVLIFITPKIIADIALR